MVHVFDFSRSVLTSLKVDPVALHSSERSGRVKGLIITMKGNQSEKHPIVRLGQFYDLQ